MIRENRARDRLRHPLLLAVTSQRTRKKAAALGVTALVLLTACAGSASSRGTGAPLPAPNLTGAAYVILGDAVGKFDVFRVDLRTLASQRLTSDVLASSIASSGATVIVSAARGEAGASPTADRLYRLTDSGLGPIRPEGLDGTGPAVSVGGVVAFTPYGAEGSMPHQIDEWDPNLSERRTLLSDPGTVWGTSEFAGADFLVTRPKDAGSELLQVRGSGAQRVIFTSPLPLGTIRAAETRIAVLIRTPGDGLSQIRILEMDGQAVGLIPGWHLLDWAPDGSGLLLFRGKVLAYAAADSYVPVVLGTLPFDIRSGAWLEGPIGD